MDLSNLQWRYACSSASLFVFCCMHDRATLAFLAFLQIVICFIGKLWSKFQSRWFVLCTCFTWLGCVGTRIQKVVMVSGFVFFCFDNFALTRLLCSLSHCVSPFFGFVGCIV